VVFEGDPQSEKGISISGNTISVPHLPPAAMGAVIKGSTAVISRSGYTTIMELASLGIPRERTTLIATPGQTEQEYLTRY
jgi:UDP-N-acetylglucosamine:LPS N-acetylglucosamine transferase